ncbi:MAG: prepilin peptidase [Sarcina sp.]
MLLLMILISVLWGLVLNFIAYFVAIEDFTEDKNINLVGKFKFCFSKLGTNKIMTVSAIGISVFIFLSLYIKFYINFRFFKFAFLFSVLLVSAIIDFKTRSVYLIVSVVGLIGGIIFSFINVLNGGSIIPEIVATTIPVLILGFLKFVSAKHDGMGGGDIEVFVFIGLYMSIVGSGLDLLVALLIGGFIAGIGLLINKSDKYIPFIPCIAISTYIVVMFGDYLLNWYLSII